MREAHLLTARGAAPGLLQALPAAAAGGGMMSGGRRTTTAGSRKHNTPGGQYQMLTTARSLTFNQGAAATCTGALGL
jgi:hypothetical protein